MAGASVTSNDAGLSVPDWPTSFGYLVKVPHFVGGVRFEWSHRMVAGSLVILTLAIAAWTLLVDRRSWLRKLALAALGTVIAQADPRRHDRSLSPAARRIHRPCRCRADFLLHRRMHRRLHRSASGWKRFRAWNSIVAVPACSPSRCFRSSSSTSSSSSAACSVIAA